MVSSYFQLISETLKCCGSGPRPWVTHRPCFGLAIPHLGLRTTVHRFPCPNFTVPKQSSTQATLIYSSDPVLLLLKDLPCSPLPSISSWCHTSNQHCPKFLLLSHTLYSSPWPAESRWPNSQGWTRTTIPTPIHFTFGRTCSHLSKEFFTVNTSPITLHSTPKFTNPGTYIISFNPHCNSVRSILLCLFYRWGVRSSTEVAQRLEANSPQSQVLFLLSYKRGNWGSEESRNLPVSQRLVGVGMERPKSIWLRV